MNKLGIHGNGRGKNGRPFVVAEIGTGHKGDLEKGKELIDAARDAGADAVKFQVVIAREMLPPEAGMVPLPGGNVPLYSVFESLERPVEFYAGLADYAGQKNIGFFASPFGEGSFEILRSLGVDIWKIASPELNHEPLLKMVARAGGLVVLSTGMAGDGDIVRALELTGGADTVLLHCVTCYPAPEDQSNVRVIGGMADRFGRPVGLSDHSLHPFLVPVLAMGQGAVMIEKHLTLDKSSGGLDDSIALVPDEFSLLIDKLERFAGVQGDVLLEEMRAEFGRYRVDSVLGDGVKVPADCEKGYRLRTMRSLHAVGSLKKGSIIGRDNTALLRTEKVLRPGLEPSGCSRAYGRRLVRDIASGDGITWDDLEGNGG